MNQKKNLEIYHQYQVKQTIWLEPQRVYDSNFEQKLTKQPELL